MQHSVLWTFDVRRVGLCVGRISSAAMRTRNFADDVFFLAVLFQLVPAAVKCSVLNARACSANAGRTGELGEYAGLDLCVWHVSRRRWMLENQ